MDASIAKTILESAFEMANLNNLAEDAIIRYIDIKIRRQDLKELNHIINMFKNREQISDKVRLKLDEVLKLASAMTVIDSLTA